MGNQERGWGAIGWVGGMLGAGWALWQLGEISGLRIDWSDPLGWLGSVDLEVALAAIARVCGLAVVAWVIVSTVVYLFACLAGVQRSRLGWLSITPIRRTIDTMLAGSLLVSSLTPGPALAAEAPPAISATSTSVVEPVDPAYIPTPAGDHPEAEVPSVSPAPSSDVRPRAKEPTTVVVAIGDHLWGLAARHVAAAIGRSPTDAEIAPYWSKVVEANRDRLRSGDPDLIYPGEEVLLPDVNPGS